MIRVRFPNGQMVQYNNANYLVWGTRDYPFHRMYADKDQKNIQAAVPVDCIIEWVNPCKIENPLVGKTAESALDMMIESVRTLKGWGFADRLKTLKKIMSGYDAKRSRWK